MKTIDIHPEYANLTDEELIALIPGLTILPLTDAIARYYDSRITMHSVYGIYGHEIAFSDTQQQVHCLLPSHGTEDRHPSARFYPIDRNTGEVKHAVYCHKCQRTSTPFWVLYARESVNSGLKMREFYLFLRKTFNVPFPRQVFFEFDPQEYYTFEESEENDKLHKIKHANLILKLKEYGDSTYPAEIKNFGRKFET